MSPRPEVVIIKNAADRPTVATINRDEFVKDISYPPTSKGSSVLILNWAMGSFANFGLGSFSYSLGNPAELASLWHKYAADLKSGSVARAH